MGLGETFADSPSRLRVKLEKRREKATSEQSLKRIPFVLDQDLADSVERIAQQHQAQEQHLAELEELKAELDATSDGDDRDVRASGHDMSDLGQSVEATRLEVQRLHEELERATVAAREAIIHLVFRRVDAAEYERLMIAAGGGLVDSDASAALAFHDSLVAACFVRIEDGGEDSGYKSWRDFIKDAGLSFGEIDPIRTIVYAMNRRGGNSIPFSLMPSNQIPTS